MAHNQKTGESVKHWRDILFSDGYRSLYLDIWRPLRRRRNHRLPVKVWLYGGSDLSGSISDPLYNGCNLAERDSIVVSINYRLGPLGWMPVPSAGIPANLGLQDQLLGLRWVQQNIEAFGGDPVSMVHSL